MHNPLYCVTHVCESSCTMRVIACIPRVIEFRQHTSHLSEKSSSNKKYNKMHALILLKNDSLNLIYISPFSAEYIALAAQEESTGRGINFWLWKLEITKRHHHIHATALVMI